MTLTIASLAFVAGIALGIAASGYRVREARRDAMAYVRAKQIAHMSTEDRFREASQ